MLLQALQDLIGVAPAGYEGIQYVFVGLFALMLVQSCVSFLSALFRLFGGHDT